MDLFKLASLFKIATEEHYPSSEKDSHVREISLDNVIRSIRSAAKNYINPDKGDSLTHISNLGFSIHTKTADSFHIYRDLEHFIGSNYPSKSQINTGDKRVFYYPKHSILLLMKKTEIKVYISSSHNIHNTHTKTINL